MVKRAIVTLLVLAAVLIAVNDGWRYASATTSLKDVTYDLARWAADNSGRMTRDDVAAQLAVMGRQRGVTVTQYGQNDQVVQIWTQGQVTGTIVAGTLVNVVRGLPMSEANEAPIVIRDYRKAGAQ